MVRSADFLTKILCTGFEGFERIVCDLFKIFDFTFGAFQVDFDPVDCRAVVLARTLVFRTALFARTLFATATAFLFRTALAAATATATTTAKAECGSFGKCFATAFTVGDFAFFEDLFALFCIEDANMFDLVAT